MELILLRHARTEGNLQRRYIGKTDEQLSPEGIAQAEKKAGALTGVEAVYTSPMLRCRQTAEILFPGVAQTILDGFRETDFGRFENKNYLELKDDPEYLQWIDSGGSIPFPGGESVETVKKRVLRAFDKMTADMKEKNINKASAVVHGGTVMALLSERARPKRSFYDWQVSNCTGFFLRISDDLRTLDLIGECK
jgi:alpha-ribazole phosphatase